MLKSGRANLIEWSGSECGSQMYCIVPFLCYRMLTPRRKYPHCSVMKLVIKIFALSRVYLSTLSQLHGLYKSLFICVYFNNVSSS
jgi:hypothetical protein